MSPILGDLRERDVNYPIIITFGKFGQCSLKT